jgi:hypothetical protein
VDGVSLSVRGVRAWKEFGVSEKEGFKHMARRFILTALGLGWGLLCNKQGVAWSSPSCRCETQST